MMTEEKNATADRPENPAPEEVRQIPLGSLDMKQLIELDACTRCGECLTWCPVYDQDANESIVPRRKVIDFLRIARTQHGLLGSIVRSEKISAPLRGLLARVLGYKKVGQAEIDDFVKNLYECSTCGQCEVVCPAHIETVTLWEELRRVIVEADYGPLEPQKALVKSVKAFDNPWQQPRAGRTKWARKAKKDGLIRELPRDIRKTKAKVLLFFGCTASYDSNVKQVAINTINILEALDIDYGILGAEERCCASVLLRMGDPEHRRVFKQNIDQFNSLGIETLISSCSGCFKTIMQDYPKIAPLNFEVLHTIEFLARLLKRGELKFPHPVDRTVTYHDPCHLGRAAGGFEAPRLIMEAIPGLKLVEMPRNREYSRCCGAGGGLKAGYPDIQNKMAQRRVREAVETGAEELVSCCPFCFQGLNVGVTALESPLVMKDISGLVAESLLGYNVFEEAAKGGAEKQPAAEDSKAARTAARETRRSARRQKTQPSESPATNDDPDGKKAAREKRRAERRAARKKGPEAPATPAPAAETAPQAEAAAAEEDARAAKKAERERKRAARRAGRKQAAAGEAPAAVAEDAGPERPETTDAPPKPAAEAPPAPAKDPGEAPADPEADRKRRRAERRAAREQEKARRRAARGGN